MSKRLTWIVMVLVLLAGGLSTPGWAADEPVSAAAPTAVPEIADIFQAPVEAQATPAVAEDPGVVWMDQMLADPSVLACNNFCCTSHTQCRTACGEPAGCLGTGICKRCVLL